MSGISIGTKINEILKSSNELTNYVGENIYPIIAEESSTFPFIVFNRNAINPQYTKDGRVFDIIPFSISIQTKAYKEGVEIAEICRGLFENRVDDYFGLVRVEGGSEYFADDVYFQTLNFNAILKS